MAETTHIVYQDSDGKIVVACRNDVASPPTAEVGQTYWNAGDIPVPDPLTQKVDTAGPAIIAIPQADTDNAQREQLRRDISILENAKDRYLGEGWATTDIQAKIDELRAAHDALP